MQFRRGTTWFWQMALLAGALLVLAAPARAWSYHSFAYGYSLTLPDDWGQVPEEAMAARMSELPSSGAARYDVAFQPKRNGNWLDHPYILVQVVPYSSLGFPQQVSESEIQQIVRGNTGIDPTNPFPTDSQVVEGGSEVESADGALRFDPQDHRFTWNTTQTAGVAGPIRLRQWGFFGKDTLVQVTLFERGRGSERLQDLVRAVAGSFKFEIGHEYQPAMTTTDVVRAARQLFTTPNMGMVVTLTCVGVAVICAIVSLTSSRRRAPAYRMYDDQD